MRRMQTVVIVVALLLVLLFTTHNFLHNDFKLGYPRQFEEWGKNDEKGVTLMLEKAQHSELNNTGGFTIQALDVPTGQQPPYLSAFGLHGQVFVWLMKLGGVTDLTAYAQTCRVAVSFLLAFLIVVFAFHAGMEFGVTAAIILLAGVNLSNWMVFTARNLYWLFFMHLLPFTVSFMVFPLVLRRPGFRFTYYLGIVGLTVLLKTLCATDYITNIIMSTACAPICYGVIYRRPWRKVLYWAVAVMAISGIMAVTGVAATWIKGGLWIGSFQESYEHLATAYFSRMYGIMDIQRATVPGVSALRIIEQYLTVPVTSFVHEHESHRYRIYLSFFAFYMAFIPLMAIAFADGRFFPRFEAQRNRLLGLTAATAWGLLASLSWAFLLKGHMSHHFHINPRIFYIPYMLLFFVLAGEILELLVLETYDALRRRLPATKQPDTDKTDGITVRGATNDQAPRLG